MLLGWLHPGYGVEALNDDVNSSVPYLKNSDRNVLVVFSSLFELGPQRESPASDLNKLIIIVRLAIPCPIPPSVQSKDSYPGTSPGIQSIFAE